MANAVFLNQIDLGSVLSSQLTQSTEFIDLPPDVHNFVIDQPFAPASGVYTMFGQYGDAGAIVGLSQAAALDAVLSERTFAQEFGVEESVIYGALGTLYDPSASAEASQNARDAVFNFFESNTGLFPELGVQGVMVKYSDAVFDGTINAAPVPEPASMAVLGAGAVALLRRRRR